MNDPVAEAILVHADALRENSQILLGISEILQRQHDMIVEMMPSFARGPDIPVHVTKTPELSVLPGMDLPDEGA